MNDNITKKFKFFCGVITDDKVLTILHCWLHLDIASGSTIRKAVLKRDKIRVFDWEWRKLKLQYIGLNTNSPPLHTNYIPNTVQYQPSVNSALLW